ncbi:hypothetical protein ACJIZ3_023465 [Penstemon smallii]|uniref:Uncharacterized protein n=1 Tax=Penstemon smallii TaxID=265156 RepID=A0ABD3TP72_9LAMI
MAMYIYMVDLQTKREESCWFFFHFREKKRTCKVFI